jgi:uncharacterized membrane protein
MTDISELFRSYGPTVAITIVFVWQGIMRESRMTKRLDLLEDQRWNALITTVERNTIALTAFANAIAGKPCGQQPFV